MIDVASAGPRIGAGNASFLTLASYSSGRDNNIQLLRLLAAMAVVLFHSYALTNNWTDEPLWRIAPELNFGALGVKMFFVISGFLVTQSWLARSDLAAFAAARALRIYPALVAATLFTMLLAAWSTDLSWSAFVQHPQTWDFFWRTATGFEVRDRLPGAFAANPFPDAVNGSLWTLPIELRLYIVLALAGALGLLARKTWWLAVVAILVAVVVSRPTLAALALQPGADAHVVAQLALLFALGSLAYVWRAAVPLSLLGGCGAIALIAWNPTGLPRGALFEPLLAYALIVLAYHPRLRWPAFNRMGDYSYGLYVYSFPLQQTLVQRIPGLAPLVLFALALLLALSVAAISWHALERPALGLKSRIRHQRLPI